MAFNLEFFVEGVQRNIHFLQPNEDIIDLITNNKMLVICWINEKNKKYFFLVTIRGYFYVLATKIHNIFGIHETNLIKILDHVINNKNYKNVFRWKNGILHIGGNLSKDIHEYVNDLRLTTNEEIKPLILKLRVNF